MNPKFEITINSLTRVNQLPGTWTDEECLKFLQHLDFDGADALAPAERREYAAMALQDKSTAEAAAALLNHLVGDKLTDGQTQNLAEEMTTGRMWEQYVDLTLHESIFNAQVLLHQAFPSAPRPEINQIEITLRAIDPAASRYLINLAAAIPPRLIPEAGVLRCIAAAMPPDAILNRLFDEQLAGAPFPEAEAILWKTRGEVLSDSDKPARKISLYSPIRWTSPLEEERTAECSPVMEGVED